MSIRTLIADDEPLAREGLVRCLSDQPDIEIIAVCENGRQALDAILAQRPELAFLDVRMPGLDGFEVVDHLAGKETPAVVFVTAHEDYAVRAFDEAAVDYLLKPIVPERVVRAVARARRRLGAPGDQPRPRRFAVPDEKRVVFVPVERVAWIESDGNYVRLHADDATHRVRATLSGLESRLAPEYVRIHRSRLVRTDRIASIERLGQGDYVVILDSGSRLVSSRSYREGVRRLLEPVVG